MLKQLKANASNQAQHSKVHSYNGFELKYPGYKGGLDYALWHNGDRPKHEDVVRQIFALTSQENFKDVVAALEDIHTNGDSATTSFFTDEVKSLIFLVTLQEEVNYPPPAKGKTLPFCRFYEGALAKLGLIGLDVVVERTNNHGKAAPIAIEVNSHDRPAFYH